MYEIHKNCLQLQFRYALNIINDKTEFDSMK